MHEEGARTQSGNFRSRQQNNQLKIAMKKTEAKCFVPRRLKFATHSATSAAAAAAGAEVYVAHVAV
jgi:hypothetical protein